ncbi:hypothetical protein FXO38_01172 [Capsicum annuum]|nr:hypothetical protein FXO38_01172 [Capsicum annuum]KAF3684973.1 hypothetical protein FXO37_01104 [Capsicum annuum]
MINNAIMVSDPITVIILEERDPVTKEAASGVSFRMLNTTKEIYFHYGYGSTRRRNEIRGQSWGCMGELWVRDKEYLGWASWKRLPREENWVVGDPFRWSEEKSLSNVVHIGKWAKEVREVPKALRHL